jgi:SpoIID/LytB domain protein
VLVNFDFSTKDFFRWKVEYTQQEISELIKNRSGIDYGDIIDLVPVERGSSGRIIKLKIHGTKKILTIGKELEIRKTLSKSHLYSSAFVVHKEQIENNIPQKFILLGSGWGHGVGLCQIGAAVMGELGYSFDEILTHYFKNATIQKIY